MPCLLWPALKCGNSEEGQHAIEHIVKVEVTVEPFSLSQHCVLKGIIHVLQEVSPESRCREQSLSNSIAVLRDEIYDV